MSTATTPTTKSECVVVAVRKRPRLPKEIQESKASIVDIHENQITITKPGDSIQKSFTFDIVIDEGHAQRALYDEIAYPLVESVIDGYNGTIFAYGQTGCGKTWTMTGAMDLDQDDAGIIPNSFDHIFEAVAVGVEGEDGEDEDDEEEKTTAVAPKLTPLANNDKAHSLSTTTSTIKKYLVQASYLEIYNEEIRDLLVDTTAASSSNDIDPRKLKLKEHAEKGVYVDGLTFRNVHNVESITALMHQGILQRTTASTNMNEKSSRSHSIFTIRIESSIVTTAEDGTETESFRVGTLNLVDLAGSERQKTTQNSGARLKEGSKINLSLSALGNVISALVDGKGGTRHIPYRDSKLTRLLQNSLGRFFLSFPQSRGPL